MGTRYENRLREFAEGKRLGRLAKAVRDVGDSGCDACASALPQTLFGLRDGNSGRYYFVGQNCLGWLLANRLVARARYRQSAETAYRLEMEARRNGDGTVAPYVAPRPLCPSPNSEQMNADLSDIRRTVLVFESSDYCTAQVCLAGGGRNVSARAREPRWSQEWVRHDGGMVLERVLRPQQAIVAICVLSAYREAVAGWCATAQRDGDIKTGVAA